MPISLPTHLHIERLFDGQPLLPPSAQWWDAGSTFNSAAVLLTLTPEHLPAIQALLGPDTPPREIVALHYRARPKEDPGFPWCRSFIGLAVCEPDLTLISRFEEPVLSPGANPTDIDYQGVEDPRITFMDGCWWMVYCGVTLVNRAETAQDWLGSVCLAKSNDLVHWTKLGAVTGTGDGFKNGDALAKVSNKDAALFPERIDGKVVKLHRPMIGAAPNWGTAIAIADSVEGPFEDLGIVRAAIPSEDYDMSWVGGGAVPISLGGGRFVSIEHTGNIIRDMKRKYVLDAVLYDFNGWNPDEPGTLMAARIDDFMRPETDLEVKGPFPESVANVVFACGSYVYEGWLYIVYGGGDSYLLGARVWFQELVEALEHQVVR